jgi:hypothetical protein
MDNNCLLDIPVQKDNIKTDLGEIGREVRIGQKWLRRDPMTSVCKNVDDNRVKEEQGGS